MMTQISDSSEMADDKEIVSSGNRRVEETVVLMLIGTIFGFIMLVFITPVDTCLYVCPVLSAILGTVFFLLLPIGKNKGDKRSN